MKSKSLLVLVAGARVGVHAERDDRGFGFQRHRADGAISSLDRDHSVRHAYRLTDSFGRFTMSHSRRIIWLVTLVVFVVFLEGSARRAAASPQDQGQSPGQQQGSFAVGHATRVLNVPGIHNVSNGGSPEPRPVNVHLWYPAPNPQNCQSGNGNGQGCPPSVYTSRLNGISLPPQWDPLSWTIGSTQAFEELPVSSAQSSYPVIIFSHGNRGNAIDYVYTLEALASFGFIVAAPDHVNDTQDDVRIDFINVQANSTVISCFDGLSSPCEVLDRVKAHDPNHIDTPVVCYNNPSIQTTVSVRESMTDRVGDVSAIIDALPTWFGPQADTSRVGVMGHSRGTVSALAAAGGSACWGVLPDSRVKAVMGLAIGARNITFRVDLHNVTVPALLVAGSLDRTAPASISNDAYSMLGTPANEKQFVLIQNAEHRHFDSGLCAQTQSSGAIAQANPTRAVLDLQTVTNILIPPNPSGTAMDFCGPDTFTNPTDITGLVRTLTGFQVISAPVANVPTTGLTSDEVKEQVIQRAVAFFGRVL